MSITEIRELSALREAVGAVKARGQRVAFVPTMGNLHAGHFSLIELARQNADFVVASIFVNPTQFGPNEDFDRYPRTPDADVQGLSAAGCDAVWMPNVATMYPMGVERAVQMRVPVITETLDGAHRPGHFDGVATVVCRLFNQVRPDVAIFGRKDYQQLAVIRAMVRDLAMPIEIIGAPTRREDSGLALSSRNQYLSAEQRSTATLISQMLQTMEQGLRAGESIEAVQDNAVKCLQQAGFDVDYAVVRQPDLTEVASVAAGQSVVALIAVRLGTTRLIDNSEFTL
ncbi:pantoate--beta-alanine ligase [Luteimonas sp. FXH3W]|uniref:Pantothenate synthetase n=1 Tax=Aquilutibacter rugosus TaxID=3115820 RepID=A0ABU7V1T0_9GAMM